MPCLWGLWPWLQASVPYRPPSGWSFRPCPAIPCWNVWSYHRRSASVWQQSWKWRRSNRKESLVLNRIGTRCPPACGRRSRQERPWWCRCQGISSCNSWSYPCRLQWCPCISLRIPCWNRLTMSPFRYIPALRPWCVSCYILFQDSVSKDSAGSPTHRHWYSEEYTAG